MDQLTSLDTVYRNTLKVLSDDPSGEAERILEDILRFWKENPPKTQYDGFEWFQVHADARTLNKLVTRQILGIAFKSNKSTAYKVTSLTTLERALNDYRGMAATLPEESGIPPDLFKIVVGHTEKKDILLRGINSEEPIHCLLHGSIASAKSLILEELSRLPRSRFVLGSSLSKAGLYDLMFTENPKYLILDEIDKIDDSDNLSALLSLTETGFLSETKYRRHRKRYFTTWVFASANYLDKIPKELLSRFCKLYFKEYTNSEFLEVATRVLMEREKIPPSLAAYIADQCLRELETKDVRDAVRLARLLKRQDKEDVDHVIVILKKQK